MNAEDAQRVRAFGCVFGCCARESVRGFLRGLVCRGLPAVSEGGSGGNLRPHGLLTQR